MATSFSHLLADIDRIDAGQSLGLHRDHDAGAEAADFSAQIREGGRRTQMAIKALSAGLGNMSKRYEADASAIETSRRAVGRARLDDLIAEIDKNIAAGLISGEEGARLDGLVHRLALNIGVPS